MAVVSLCFSGNPRTILTYRDAWQQYFDMIRRQHELRIFFHCWSQRGLVIAEGVYHEEVYASFDELIAFLKPKSFRIDTPDSDYSEAIDALGYIYTTSAQAHPTAILSQIHSIYLAEKLSRRYDTMHGAADAVVKLRFDLRPNNFDMTDIDLILRYPNSRLLFGPSPVFHRHQGGGGGCGTCQAFFERSWRESDYPERESRFLGSHPHHSNDICDLYAVGNARTMEIYSSAYAKIYHTYKKVKSLSQGDTSDYVLQTDRTRSINKIIDVKSGRYNIEVSPVFVPEKFIRVTMEGFVVAHGQSSFVIERR